MHDVLILVACTCHLPGTILGDNMCDPVTGQCLCKVNVNSEYCQACIPGTYNLLVSGVCMIITFAQHSIEVACVCPPKCARR